MKKIISEKRTATTPGIRNLCILSLALLLFFLSACSKNEKTEPAESESEGTEISTAAEAAAEGNPEEIRLTDMLGRETVLTGSVTKLVALTPAECEIVYALGAGDVLIGRGEYCDYPEEAAELPSMQSGYETNIEQILALAPQVVLMGDMDSPDETVEQLEKAGVHVVMTDADDFEGVYTSIDLIGRLLGKETEAAGLIGDMKASFEEIREKAFPEGSTVYFEVSPLEWGLWAAAKGTFMNEAAELMGLENCFDDVEGWAQISEEQVLERDPDLIVTISMYSGGEMAPEEEILSRTGWENVSAVKKKAVLNLENNELSRPGPRLAEGTKALYDFAEASLKSE